MSRVLLVSNRLPITVRRAGKKKEVTRSSGGLVAGLGPVHDESGGLWIGTLGSKGGIEAADLRAQRLVEVTLAEDQAKRHYEGYSNQVLWPLFHYLVQHVHFEGLDFDAYRSVNERFADTVAEHVEPGDTVWVHDYHLMLLPAMLRERFADLSIGFFLHIPFPSSEVFRILPRKEEILRGLMGANLIGLHTYDYARHLVSSFRRVLGVEFDDDWVTARDGSTRVGVFPLGVDAEGISETARSSAVDKRLGKLAKTARGRKVVLGVDRMDYTKGLELRFQAFRRFLKEYKAWRGKVMFLQLCVPSRSNIASYKELKQQVDRRVGQINGEFEHDGRVPVHYLYRSVPPAELMAMYRIADVAWVTPVRDGMNLVAKEYVAARQEDTGVLVLSEFAGAASEMGEALQHNPWDIGGSARILERALSIEAGEMSQRMASLRRRVHANTVHRWVERFLEALFGQHEHHMRSRYENGASSAAAGWVGEMSEQFEAAGSALVALDYDGTLVDLKPTPEQAAPDSELEALLREVGALAGVKVVVISGRDPDTLGRWLGELPVSLVAEHGLHWRLEGGDWDVLLHNADTSWKGAVREILEDYSSRSPGSFIEEKPASLAWHYRQVEPAFGNWQARELAQHLSEAFANAALSVLHGAKVVEVRPQGFDKGRAHNLLWQRLGPFDFELVAGDDRTDEDMFQVLPPEAWSIKVGSGRSHARYAVPTPAILRQILADLSARRRR